MNSTTTNFSIKESLSNNSSALLLGDFCILNWDNKKRYLPTQPTLRELLEQLKIYPEAREYLKEQSDKIQSTVKYLEEHFEDLIYRKAKNEEWVRDILWSVYINPRKEILKRNNFILENKSDKFILSIDKAKEYPITNLIDFKKNVAKCIWHNDKNPSMQYYPKTNTVYCWSCKEYGDVVKVYQQLNGCSFKEALKALQ